MTAEERILDAGYEDVLIMPDYDAALIGVTTDNRAVYDYYKMVECLIGNDGFTWDEAVEWIDYNTIRALPYAGESAPIIIYRV